MYDLSYNAYIYIHLYLCIYIYDLFIARISVASSVIYNLSNYFSIYDDVHLSPATALLVRRI